MIHAKSAVDVLRRAERSAETEISEICQDLAELMKQGRALLDRKAELESLQKEIGATVSALTTTGELDMKGRPVPGDPFAVGEVLRTMSDAEVARRERKAP